MRSGKFAGIVLWLGLGAAGAGCDGLMVPVDVGSPDAGGADARVSGDGGDGGRSGDARVDADAAATVDAALGVDASPELDATVGDASAEGDGGLGDDAHVEVDAAPALDAFVGMDAYVAPDAYVPPDAYVAPDAYVPPSGLPVLSSVTGLEAITSISVAADGTRVAVGMPYTDYGGHLDTGTVAIFRSTPSAWVLEETLGLGFTDYETFGRIVALSADGSRLAVAQAPTGTTRYVHLYQRSGTTWTETQVLSDGDAFQNYAASLAFSSDGYTLAVGRTAVSYGQVLVYRGDATHLLTLRATLGPEHTTPGGGYRFGASIGMSGDAHTLVVGAPAERSAATGVDGDWTSTTATSSGAAYVLTETAPDTWTQTAYLKASNTEAYDGFGTAVALSRDGSTIAATAPSESSAATGVGGDQSSNTASSAGAVYVFRRSASTWVQSAYVKASDTAANDSFGRALTLGSDGSVLAAIGGSGFAPRRIYLFDRSSGGAWSERLRTSLTDAFAESLAGDASFLAVGTYTSFGAGPTQGTIVFYDTTP